MKHDERHKAHLVVNGHLIDEPLKSTCSGAVSLCGICFLLFIAELNGVKTWTTNVGNAHLEAKTNKKTWIEASPEFGETQGCALVAFIALVCGPWTSCMHWCESLTNCMCKMGFEPSKAG
jgi:hypothetical protein